MYQQSVINKSKFLLFEECIDEVSKLNINSLIEWRKIKKPKNIPSCPNKYFSNQWISWTHWLSLDKLHNKNRDFYEFDECRKLCRNLKLKNLKEWHIWSKCNKDTRIPSNPDKTYKNDWISWTDWLNNNNKSLILINKKFLSFEKAREHVHSLNIKTQNDWFKLKKPSNIPSQPHRTYKKEWLGYGDWLGTNKIATQNRKYKSFELARKFALSLKVSSIYDWHDLCKKNKIPDDIPKNPNKVYSEKGWISYYDFLGCSQTLSKGELIVQNYLVEHDIIFVKQKTFKDCKSINLLKFDFYLPDLNICIEYDGIQHFKSIEYFGGNKSFLNNIKRDRLKDKFCQTEKINLVRIKYTDCIYSKLKTIQKI